MVGLTDGEKKHWRICITVSTEYRRVTDRRTDRWTDILPRHSPRYAYASRGKIQQQDLLRERKLGQGRWLLCCREARWRPLANKKWKSDRTSISGFGSTPTLQSTPINKYDVCKEADMLCLMLTNH